MFLFDTDTITNIVKPTPSLRLLRQIDQLLVNQQYISTITISEIVYGAEKSQRADYHLNNLKIRGQNTIIANILFSMKYTIYKKIESMINRQTRPGNSGRPRVEELNGDYYLL